MNEKIKELKNDEYEAQFFGCSSSDVINGTKNIIKLAIKSCVENMEESLKKHYGNAATDIVVSQIGQKMTDLYFKASDVPLKNLEEEIKDCFRIPSNVLLPEDEPQKYQYSAADVEAVDSEIDNLLKRAEKAKFVEAALEKEFKSTDDIIENLEQKVSYLEEIIYKSDNDKQVLTNIIKNVK